MVAIKVFLAVNSYFSIIYFIINNSEIMKFKICLYIYITLNFLNLFSAELGNSKSHPIITYNNYEIEKYSQKYKQFNFKIDGGIFFFQFYKIEHNLRKETGTAVCVRSIYNKIAIIDNIEIINDYFSKEEIIDFIKQFFKSLKINLLFYEPNNKWQIYLLK
jgi:hypothetical protein